MPLDEGELVVGAIRVGSDVAAVLLVKCQLVLVQPGSNVVRSLDIAQVFHSDEADSQVIQFLPLLSVLMLADVHHHQRKLLRVSIREGMTESVDEIGVVLFIECIFEELMALDFLQLFDKRLSE